VGDASLKRIGFDVTSGKLSLGAGIAWLFELLAESHLIQPTIIYDFPLAVSPLSKKSPPNQTGSSASSSTSAASRSATPSPSSTIRRPARPFEQQMTEKERGDHEAHQMDADYVRALGYASRPPPRRHRHRPPHHASHQLQIHSRRHPLPPPPPANQTNRNRRRQARRISRIGQRRKQIPPLRCGMTTRKATTKARQNSRGFFDLLRSLRNPVSDSAQS